MPQVLHLSLNASIDVELSQYKGWVKFMLYFCLAICNCIVFTSRITLSDEWNAWQTKAIIKPEAK